MNQHLSFIDCGKAVGGNAKARTGLGKSDRPGSQGGLRKRGTMVGRANPLRYRKRVNGSNSPNPTFALKKKHTNIQWVMATGTTDILQVLFRSGFSLSVNFYNQFLICYKRLYELPPVLPVFLN